MAHSDKRVYGVCMKFDKTKVYSSANADEVKRGSVGYFADTLRELKAAVKDGRAKRTLTRVEDDSRLYRFCPGKADTTYALFYLVKEPKKEELCTYRELAQWLLYGGGEFMYVNSGFVTTYFSYNLTKENDTVDVNTYLVRKWGDTEWHVPTREYMGIEE